MANPSLPQSTNVVMMVEVVVATCLALAISAIIFAVIAGAAPINKREIVDCVAAPTTGEEGPDRWLYRFVDGRTCWFIAGNLRRGREKPIEELRWPAPPLLEINDRPPWPTECPSTTQFENRWNGKVEDRQ